MDTQSREHPRSVVITGSSSGIGRASALLLAQRGFQIFAGVRRPADGAALRSEGGEAIAPIILDVTEGDSIASAAEDVTRRLGGRPLGGLVNVAGIGVAGPVEYVTPAELRRMFEVDVFGQVAVTQAFLPLIRQARGRIVNISSVGAHIAMPFGGVLGAAKSALGVLTDALRLELRPFGVPVATIEPGAGREPARGGRARGTARAHSAEPTGALRGRQACAAAHDARAGAARPGARRGAEPDVRPAGGGRGVNDGPA